MGFFYFEACYRRMELLETMLMWQDDTPNLLWMCIDQKKEHVFSWTNRFEIQTVLDFGTPNSDFRTQRTNKHFDLLHSFAVQLSPELYFVTTKFQKGRSLWPRGQRLGSAAASLLVLRV
jgi:hypothetical protein